MNRLSTEKSPYLRHAANQKIEWYPWCAEAFETAKQKNKPVFLSSGAVWCHWCHVMAKECFESEEIIKFLNEHFINIKLDRDERPDIDRRYQRAVSVMGFGGGWPLSVFLTPDKEPFFGGTYFPLEDSLGRPGFQRVLKAVTDFYISKKEDIFEYSRKIMGSIKQGLLPDEEIKESLIGEAVTDILSHFDPQNGGFGASPKFPAPGALELLTNKFFFTKKESIGFAVKKTLESMAKGGFHDQIGGGFHRYSVDEAWSVPHFEKMADDNAWHLRNYINAYAVFGLEYFKEVAEGIINFIGDVFSDPFGGFYSSQDADVSPDDEGGYFTWTDADFEKVLTDEEFRVLSLHLLGEKGAMHHDRSKKVLFISLGAEEIAEKTGMNRQIVLQIINRGKKKLLEGRNKREAPFIDRTLYTSVNGMLISAYLKAFRVLKYGGLKAFSLKSLNRIMTSHFIDNELLHTEGIKALLDDYMNLIDALSAAYEATGDLKYLHQADNFMEVCIDKFWDNTGGGFFDTDGEVLGIRFKNIEDIPHPSANSLGIMLLLKLHFMTGKEKYHDCAEKALKVFSSTAKDMGIHSGYYFCAADAYFNMVQLTCQTSPSSGLAETALSLFRPYVSIIYGEDKGIVIPCMKDVCYAPINSPGELEDFLRTH